MFSQFKSFFLDNNNVINNGNDNKPDNNNKIAVAACAILLEMAHIDGEFSDDERTIIVKFLETNFNMPQPEVENLIEVSKKELSESSDLWEFTSCLNESMDHSEKTKLMELIWRIIYSDNSLDKHEDYLVHKLQKLLRMTHEEMIDIKIKVKPKFCNI